MHGTRHGREPFEIRADVVVGADGRYSALRRLGQFEIEYQHHDFDIIWFVIEQPPDWPNTIYISLGSDVRGLMLPKYPHHIQAGFALPTGEWSHWREAGIAAVAEHVRRFDPVFAEFAAGLQDFKPFFPLEGQIVLVKDWARDGMVLIGDAAHTMSPAGAIGVNVALATAAVAAQEIYPLLGHGPIAHDDLTTIQQLREGDVRTLHRFQLGAQRVLLAQGSSNPIMSWLLPGCCRCSCIRPCCPACSAGCSWCSPATTRSRVQLSYLIGCGAVPCLPGWDRERRTAAVSGENWRL